MKQFTLLFGIILLVFLARAQSFDLLILGTAQDAGFPQAGCSKSCCANAKHRESVASIAIAHEGKFWIIDATPDLTEQLALCHKEFPNHTFEGIFLTHAHIGHYTGLMYLGKEAMNTVKTPVYCMPRMAEFLRTNGPWSQLVELENISLIELKADNSFPLSGSASILPVVVPHRDEFSETVGFIIASDEKKAIYIPDIDKWERWNKSILEYIALLDIAILDATFYDGSELPGRNMDEIPHPFVVESLELFDSLSEKKKKRVYLTHFNHTNPLLNPDSPQTNQVKKEVNIARTGLKL
ncbi:MAG: MBL fold metallo-hydrolase [Flavobacteriales bacterium]